MNNVRFADLADYIHAHFPQGNLQTYWPIISEIYVRYELGSPFNNGTDERIKQVNYRANSIIEACFRPADQLLILINDYQGKDPMFGNTTPHYLYELIGEPVLRRADERIIEELEEDFTSKTPATYVKQVLIPTVFRGIRYKEILAGVANYEQGREPSIGQKVWFISKDRGIAYYMYDDRGCIVFSNSPRKIKHLYEKYNAWLDDYWRDSIDEVFRETA